MGPNGAADLIGYLRGMNRSALRTDLLMLLTAAFGPAFWARPGSAELEKQYAQQMK